MVVYTLKLSVDLENTCILDGESNVSFRSTIIEVVKQSRPVPELQHT
jgi:hypothetical protein